MESNEQNSSLKDATKIKLMESFAQLDGFLAQLENKLNFIEQTVSDVERRTNILQQKIQISTITGTNPKQQTTVSDI